MLIVDGDGTLRALSESLARLVGRPAEELVGEPVWGLLPGWSPTEASGRSYGLRLPALGASIEVQVSCESLRVHEEKLYLCDITTPSRRVDSASGEAIMVTGCDGDILHVNAALEALTGYGAAELRGRTPSLLKSGVHEAAVYGELWRTLLSRDVYRGVLVNKRKNGELYREAKIIRPVARADGWPILFFSSGWQLGAACRDGAAAAGGACTTS